VDSRGQGRNRPNIPSQHRYWDVFGDPNITSSGLKVATRFLIGFNRIDASPRRAGDGKEQFVIVVEVAGAISGRSPFGTRLRGSTDAEQLTRELSKPRNDRVAVGPEDHFHVSCRCRLIEGTIDNPPSGKVPYARRHQRDTQSTGNEARQRICLYNFLRDAWDEARFDAAVAKVLGKARVFEAEEHMVIVPQIRETQAAVLC
jgi:hypothetical protein